MKKTIKRITTLAMAIAMLGAGTASTLTAKAAYVQSATTQDSCESSKYMSNTCYVWQRNYPDGSIWSEANTLLSSGTVCGKNYSSSILSGKGCGYSLRGSEKWARMLAESYFDTKTFMELSYNSNTKLNIGDQIRLNNAKSLFITSINNNTIYCSELNDSNNRINWNVEYQIISSNRIKNKKQGNTYNINYITRPIKQGDANGDGKFDNNDVVWIQKRIGSNIGSLGISRTDIFKKAIMSDSYNKIEYSTYYSLNWNMNHKDGVQGAYNDTGRMTYDGANDYHYVKMTSNG